ncbi:isocitrate dehydrogenase kinase/phosphatase [Escherichia coli]|nr:isocitrate dehydrogenase kinase/phosphatase [Escherichia coli]
MRVISDLPLRLRWQNKSRDIHYIIRHLTETLGQTTSRKVIYRWRTNCFNRNKAAWLVGKLITPSGTLPFLLPIHQTDDGELFIDTCLTTTAEASIVFGFARSYFMVYAPLPAALSSGYGKFCQVKPLLNVYGYRLPEARQNRKLPRISRLSTGL